MQKLLKCRHLRLDLRLRMFKCYVFPTVLYGMEGFTLTQSMENKISAFEMWVYGIMLRISWRDHITNIELLKHINTEAELMMLVKKRKLTYFYHVKRN